VVTRYDSWITPEERAACDRLASELTSIAIDLLERHGEDVPNARDAHGDWEREPDLFLRMYRRDGFYIKWTGPKVTPSDWSFVLVLRWQHHQVARLINTAPAVLDCSLEFAEECLKAIRLHVCEVMK
jgi:hypothetical protein